MNYEYLKQKIDKFLEEVPVEELIKELESMGHIIVKKDGPDLDKLEKSFNELFLNESSESFDNWLKNRRNDTEGV